MGFALPVSRMRWTGSKTGSERASACLFLITGWGCLMPQVDRMLDGAAEVTVWLAVLMVAGQIIRGFCGA